MTPPSPSRRAATLRTTAVHAIPCGPRTRALLLNTPWNPTGTVLRREELAAVAALGERRKEEEEGQPERNSPEKEGPV